MNIDEWARHWNIPPEAMTELRYVAAGVPPIVSNGSSESAVQSQVRLAASQAGARLWRNNIGAYQDGDRYVRYGLANESKRENAMVKSSDLIGIQPIQVGGVTIGRFVAREVKRADWKYSDTPRERAQLRFLEIVRALGGDADFTTGGYP